MLLRLKFIKHFYMFKSWFSFSNQKHIQNWITHLKASSSQYCNSFRGNESIFHLSIQCRVPDLLSLYVKRWKMQKIGHPILNLQERRELREYILFQIHAWWNWSGNCDVWHKNPRVFFKNKIYGIQFILLLIIV